MTTQPTPTGIEATHALTATYVNHIIGQAYGPLVQVEYHADNDAGEQVVVCGQIDPPTAREIAGNLMAAAARAEYESDLVNGGKKAGWDDELVGMLVHVIRDGETARVESTFTDQQPAGTGKVAPTFHVEQS